MAQVCAPPASRDVYVPIVQVTEPVAPSRVVMYPAPQSEHTRPGDITLGVHTEGAWQPPLATAQSYMPTHVTSPVVGLRIVTNPAPQSEQVRPPGVFVQTEGGWQL